MIGFLDHTWSRGGRARLRELLLTPLGHADFIMKRQRVLQRLGSRLTGFDSTDLGHLLESVDRYASSSLVELPQTSLGCMYVRLRYPGMVEELVGGLEALIRLLDKVQLLAGLLENSSEEDELLPIATLLASCLQRRSIRALRRARTGSRRQLRLACLDRTVRRTDREVLIALIDALYRLDALQSLARASQRSCFTYPEVVDSRYPLVTARRAFHPLISSPTPFDIDLDSSGRVVFLTGPNMAGKTTYLKTCGIIVVLAHIGMAVPAMSARVSIFDRLFAVLSIHDNIDRGESYFLAEVRRVGELVDRLSRGERMLALVDEMFKGTNVMDAHDATELVVSRLARCEKSVFMVSSHLVELADRLSPIPAIRFLHFDAAIGDGRLLFSYELKPGVSRQRLGMALLEREEVARSLEGVERAQSV